MAYSFSRFPYVSAFFLWTLGIYRVTMPRAPPTHNDNRMKHCIFCRKKASEPRPVKSCRAIYEKIKTLLPNYDPDDQRLPGSVCACCRMKFKKNPNPQLFDFSTLEFPASGEALRDLKGSDCLCLYCKSAGAHCGQIGHTFGNNSKAARPHPMGRPWPAQPAQPAQPKPAVELPSPGPIVKCKRCLQDYGPGKPHPPNCGLNQRRQNIRELSMPDLRGREMEAAQVFREKSMGSAPGEVIELDCGRGKSTKVVKPKTRASKALFPDTPIPADAVSQFATSNRNMSLRQQKRMTAKFRTWKGRDLFEPNLMDKLRDKDRLVEDLYGILDCNLDVCGSYVRADRSVVFCNHFRRLFALTFHERGWHESTEVFVKIGIDAGQGSLKVCATLQKVVNDLSSPDAKSTKRFSYQAGPSGERSKDSGVNKLLILAIVEDAKESHHNLKTLMDLLNIDIPYCACMDLKCGLTFCGLGTAASTYRCPYCEMHYKDFKLQSEIFQELPGDDLRTFQSIFDNSAKYHEAATVAAANPRRKNKLPTKDFKSCENVPLFNFDVFSKSMLVLEVFPPMELHTFLGLFPDIYKVLYGSLEALGTEEDDGLWSIREWLRPFGLKIDDKFNGEMMTDLLDSVPRLQMLLGRNTPHQPIMDCFLALKTVKSAVFSLTVDDDYLDELQNLLDCWRKVPELSFTPKFHIMVKHVPEFMSMFDEKKGLGYYSEHAFEAVHSDFERFWTGCSYRRRIGHWQYKTKFRECVRAYVSRRLK